MSSPSKNSSNTPITSTDRSACRKLRDNTQIAQIELERGLYVVATPIGNLEDISARALQTLAAADAVLCEDTRRTRYLLQRFAIKKPLLSYHDHTSARQRERLIQRLEAGQSLALVSDAGTPCIADPGFKLVRAAHERGVIVRAVPGANAAIAALSIAGLPTDRFMFEGFLPARETARRQRLEQLKVVDATLVFYETGQRLADMLIDVASVFGDVPAAIARELTKRFETVERGRLPLLAKHYNDLPPAKGEIVVIIDPRDAKEAGTWSDEAIDGLLRVRLGGEPPKEVARQVAAMTGRRPGEIYDRLIGLKDRSVPKNR